jgi:TP901 family phage tail tape measure protein
MARKLVIKTVFTASDKAIKPMRKLSGRFEKLTSKMRKSSLGLGKLMGGIIGSRLIIGGLNAIKRGIGAVTNQFIDFDQAITAAGAKFGDAFKRGTKGALELRKVARKIGAETEFTATQAGQGLDFLALASFSAAQSMGLLPGVVDLATSTNLDLARATDIASDSIGAFNLMTDDSVQLQKNFTRIMDVMAKTTTTANTDMNMLFESVKAGAPAFTGAGQSLETFSAFAGKLAEAGVKGTKSGTDLRNMMLALAGPTGDAQKTLNKLNVTTTDSTGNFRDAIDIIADIEKGLKGYGTAQKSAALKAIFGKRTVTSMNILLAKGSDELRKYRNELLNSQGASKDLAEEMRKSLKNQLEKIKSGLTEVGFKFFDVFGKTIQKSIKFISKLVDKLNKFLAVNKKIIKGGFGKFLNFIKKIFIKLQPTIKMVELLLKNIADKIKSVIQSGQGMAILRIIFETILSTINRVVALINMFVNTIANIGQRLGIMQTLLNIFLSLKNVWDSVLKVAKDMFKVLEKTGTLELLVNLFKLLGNALALVFKLLKPVIHLFGFLFKIIMFALSPIIKLINGLVTGLNFVLNALNKLGRGRQMEGFGAEGGELPKGTQTRLTEAGVDKQRVTNIEKALLEIRGVNLPPNLEFQTSGNLENVNLDLGVNK